MDSFEEQVRAYRKLAEQIAELEQKRRELSQLIFQQMPEKAMAVGEYTVRRYERLSFKTPLEEARAFGATKTEEVLDKKLLKELYEAGQPVSGVTPVTYISVSLKKSPTPSEIID